MADSVTLSTPKADSGEGAERIRKMVREYLDTMQDARDQAYLARDYYDGKQWTKEEIATLRQRGQPPIVFNRIKRKVDSILGVERQRRTDPKAYPRTPKDEQSAEIATQALRFVADQTRLNAIFSGAFENGMIEGTGACEIIVDGEGEITANLIPFDTFIFDPRRTRHDFSDARYKGVVQWMDVDDAVALYPDKKKEIEGSLEGSEKAFIADTQMDDKPNSGQWVDRKRRRVQVCQLYYKQGADWHYAVVVGSVLIQDGKSYYVDDKGKTCCPIIAFAAYIDRDNGSYGVVHDMRGPQDEINHRRSKAVHFLHSRRVMAMQGAVQDIAAAKREIARPDGWVEVVDPQSVEVLDTAQETTGNLNMLQEAKAEIDLLGPNNALQGKGTEDQSGRAIIAQQQAGLAELAPLYDRFNDFKLRAYRAIWMRIKQAWRAPKWVRVTDDPQSPQFIGLNQIQGMDPMTGQPQIMNPVAQMDVDIIIETGPDTINLQGEEFEQLAQVLPQLAQMPPPYAMALIEASSFPSQRKQKLMELLSGQGQQQDPEAMAMQKRAAEAEIAGQEAEVGLKQAQAQKLLMPEPPKPVDPFEAQIKTGELQLQARELDLKERELSIKERELAQKADELASNERVEMARMDNEHKTKREETLSKERESLREKGFSVPAGEDTSGVNLAEVMAGLSEGLAGLGDGMRALAEAQSKPKRVVRDPSTGRVVGTE